MPPLTENTYRSVLVPLDGSDFAEQALPAALTLARRHGARLHLVRVYVPVAGVYGERAVPYDQALDHKLMKQARDYLDGVVKRVAEAAGTQLSSVLLEGSVADTISRHAATVGADLCVMTTHARGPLARFWLGSVSDELARQADVPILFVRPDGEAVDFSHELAFQRVLIPLDGSPLAERVLEPVLALGTRTQTELTLLRVVVPMVELSYASVGGTESRRQLQELDEEEAKRAQEYLERVAKALRARSFTVMTRLVSNDRPATAILDDATAHGADLIALSTRCRGGLRRLLLGSVADKVLRGAATAVLVYRPTDGTVPSEQ